ncbi:YdcH family protein [Shewanella sp. Isolate7]|uniref:YdcH family protein n=1 Tax=Shewanella sp. Isolate7 TaxID=2908528 RepID=UPI001EFD51AC|nr:YdcH family protein [Shewanella sp. Isolate7]MCG9721891.1 YdcH family protein [Shewanella sp. Isolate7]
MFPEYRDLISELKSKDAHFLKMFNKHNELDDEIKELEQHAASDFTPEVKVLKQQKLHIKEELHQILQAHDK